MLSLIYRCDVQNLVKIGKVIDKKSNIPSQYEGVPIDAKFTIMTLSISETTVTIDY